MIAEWVHHTPAITLDKAMWCHTTSIELFYFDDNFRRIALWVSAFTPFTLHTNQRLEELSRESLLQRQEKQQRGWVGPGRHMRLESEEGY